MRCGNIFRAAESQVAHAKVIGNQHHDIGFFKRGVALGKGDKSESERQHEPGESIGNKEFYVV